MPFILMFLSVVCRAIEQIKCFRQHYTWLPDWLFKSNGVFNIDPYHIISGIHYWAMFFSGYFWARQDINQEWIAVAWLVYGQAFNLLFHYALILPIFRDYAQRTVIGWLVVRLFKLVNLGRQ